MEPRCKRSHRGESVVGLGSTEWCAGLSSGVALHPKIRGGNMRRDSNRKPTRIVHGSVTRTSERILHPRRTARATTSASEHRMELKVSFFDASPNVLLAGTLYATSHRAITQNQSTWVKGSELHGIMFCEVDP